MSDETILDLARRLVVGRKRDGRSVYDAQAKRELILACRAPGVSMAKLARECGINANQLSAWVRQYERAASRGVV
ncbi:MAG: transposase, partial [Cytophagales bacterium]|nr:transposase [Rhizobacter sp.]